MNWQKVREQFPQLREQGVTYLDSAATALKPRSVIDALSRYYSEEVANIHRSAHWLAAAGTSRYEGVRAQVQKFLNARTPEEVVFTKGTTEGLNLLAHCLSSRLVPGDEILVTEMEHHSNIVPWQLVAELRGLKVKAVPVSSSGELDKKALQRMLGPKTKIFSIVHLSNVLGVVNPVEELIELARSNGTATVVDAAQSVALRLVDVQALNCDFLVFSGHKMYAPNGVGVLYGRREALADLPPYQGGGSMIDTVEIEKTTYLGIPQRFEAGTPPIGDVVGLGEALNFLSQFSTAQLMEHGRGLVEQFVDGLATLKDVEVYGQSSSRASVVSFNLKGLHASDVGQILSEQKIAIRTGHHCCQPLMKALGVSGTARASFGIYSNAADVEACLSGLATAKRILQ